MPLDNAAPPQVDHWSNFSTLMKEDPFLAQYYAMRVPGGDANFSSSNQNRIRNTFFQGDMANYNDWVNRTQAGGSMWDQRGGNALDVRDPQAYQRIMQMLGGANYQKTPYMAAQQGAQGPAATTQQQIDGAYRFTGTGGNIRNWGQPAGGSPSPYPGQPVPRLANGQPVPQNYVSPILQNPAYQGNTNPPGQTAAPNQNNPVSAVTSGQNVPQSPYGATMTATPKPVQKRPTKQMWGWR